MNDTTLSPRQELLLTLSSDLAALGWGQKHKLWHLTGDADEEWLTFATEFSGAPQRHLDELQSGDLPVGTRGLVIASEGWSYPQRVLDALTDASAYAAHVRTIPPDEHPDRVEIRHVLLVCADGEVLALTSQSAADTASWARATVTPGSVAGEATVDSALRVLRGEAADWAGDVAQRAESLAALRSIADVIERSLSANLSEDETARELFFSMPPSMRQRLVEEAPTDIRNILRNVLSPDERREYGL